MRTAEDKNEMFRKAFEGSLPQSVEWRKKQRFADGAVSLRSLESVAERISSESEFDRGKGGPEWGIRTKG